MKSALLTLTSGYFSAAPTLATKPAQASGNPKAPLGFTTRYNHALPITSLRSPGRQSTITPHAHKGQIFNDFDSEDNIGGDSIESHYQNEWQKIGNRSGFQRVVDIEGGALILNQIELERLSQDQMIDMIASSNGHVIPINKQEINGLKSALELIQWQTGRLETPSAALFLHPNISEEKLQNIIRARLPEALADAALQQIKFSPTGRPIRLGLDLTSQLNEFSYFTLGDASYSDRYFQLNDIYTTINSMTFSDLSRSQTQTHFNLDNIDESALHFANLSLYRDLLSSSYDSNIRDALPNKLVGTLTQLSPKIRQSIENEINFQILEGINGNEWLNTPAFKIRAAAASMSTMLSNYAPHIHSTDLPLFFIEDRRPLLSTKSKTPLPKILNYLSKQFPYTFNKSHKEHLGSLFDAHSTRGLQSEESINITPLVRSEAKRFFNLLLGNPRLTDMAAIMAKAESIIRKREFDSPEYSLLRAALLRYCEIAIREVAMTTVETLELSPILRGKPEFYSALLQWLSVFKIGPDLESRTNITALGLHADKCIDAAFPNADWSIAAIPPD